ncbi:OLC1v1021279C1 [Oldenlandia corymbosa var. corymbosa]|uniref:OLC1v1021279C1 n=1 Tax=Oldenlandia corymbosa var. corymbosa TaxID=529605 RepID=A0AAV1BXJ1_OLDCO|nr:OLC1v1021279C1 [Oldenlandia corymbosa var. corymbosa]
MSNSSQTMEIRDPGEREEKLPGIWFVSSSSGGGGFEICSDDVDRHEPATMMLPLTPPLATMPEKYYMDGSVSVGKEAAAARVAAARKAAFFQERVAMLARIRERRAQEAGPRKLPVVPRHRHYKSEKQSISNIPTFPLRDPILWKKYYKFYRR